MPYNAWRALLDRQHGVVTEGQAAQHGVTAASIEGRVRRGLYQRMGSGTIATFPTTPTLKAIEVATCLANPTAYLSHFSAGRRWHLKVPSATRAHIVVRIDSATARGDRPRDTSSLQVHRSRHLGPHDVGIREGLPVTSVPRTVTDLFQILESKVDRHALVTEAFRLRQTTLPLMTAVVLGQPRLRRRGELLETVQRAAGGSQSAGELRLYELILTMRLPEVERQYPLRVGNSYRYLDCAVPTYQLAIEYDGEPHLRDTQRNDDLRRDQQLRKMRWHTIRVTSERLRNERALADDIWHELSEQAARLGMEAAQRPT